MRGHLVTPDATVTDPDARTIAATVASGGRFWLDLSDPDAATTALLRDGFRFHPLAVEDAEHFGQRPKIDDYDEFLLVVAYGLTDDGDPVEVHCFYTDRYLVTVHRDAVAVVQEVLLKLHRRAVPLPEPVMLLYRVLDGLVDGYFPVLDAMDELIDALEDDILRHPTDQQLGQLFRLKRRLISVRKLAVEQRDMFNAVLSGGMDLPGMTPDAERYFRDLYDHLVRISQTADSYRDLMSSVLDTHLSTTSNRLNMVMKQLAIIATVFLPMSFLTGFFGQNFGWMVDRIGGPALFWVAGVALQVVTAVSLLAMFRRKGWLGGTGP
jgi:magnesium transporter